MDFKKVVKKSSDFIKDVSNSVKTELEKRKENYLEQKHEREQKEREEQENRELLRMHYENEAKKYELERIKLRKEQEKEIRENQIFSQDFDKKATSKKDPTDLLNDQLIKTDDKVFFQILYQLASFEPEPIFKEDDLQAQIATFLRARFPDMDIIREEPIENNARPDIIIDNQYVLEVKVPQNRSSLQSLTGQLDEYRETFDNICAVIFDDENSNLSSLIRDYAQRYYEKYNVSTVILRGRKRNLKIP